MRDFQSVAKASEQQVRSPEPKVGGSTQPFESPNSVATFSVGIGTTWIAPLAKFRNLVAPQTVPSNQAFVIWFRTVRETSENP